MAFVDVSYGGEFLVSTFAEFDGETLRFDVPEEIAESLPDTDNDSAVASALAAVQRYDRPGHCQRESLQHCFAPQQLLRVEFDPANFSAEILLNPRILSLQQAHHAEFLPEHRHRVSSLSSLALAVDYTEVRHVSRDERINLAWRQQLSAGNRRLQFDTGLHNSDETYLGEFNFVYERRDERLTAGRYFLDGDRLSPSAMALAVGVRQINELRLDLQQLGATSIEVFLAEDSRVEFYRDGRLLASKNYGSGRQQLDVSELPDGAYTLTVRATAGGRELLNEEHYFVKSTRLPPLGEYRLEMDMGVLAEALDPQLLEGGEFFRMGYGSRLNQSLYNHNSVLVTPRWLALQGELQWLAPTVFAELSGQLASDRYAAATATLRWQTRWGSLAAEWYRADSRAMATGIEPDPLRRSNRDQESVSLRYLRVAPTTTVSAGVQYLEQEAQESYSFGGRWDHYLLAGKLRVSTMFQYDNLLRAAAGVELRWSLYGESGVGWVAATNGEGERFAERYTLGAMTHHWMEDGAGVNVNVRGESVDHRRLGFAQVDYQSPRLRASMDWADEWSDSRARTGRLTMSTNMLVSDGEADFFTGGGVRSGLYVVVAGKPGYPVELVINERRRISLVTGQRKFIALPYYRVYDLRIQAAKASPLEFANARQRVVLYPGSVPLVRWQAASIVAVYGQINAPELAATAPLEVRSGMSRDRVQNGDFFALDAASDERALRVYQRGRLLCELTLPAELATEEVVDLGEQECRGASSETGS